jgi:hypothetical protein
VHARCDPRFLRSVAVRWGRGQRRLRIYVERARQRPGAEHDPRCLQTGAARLGYVHRQHDAVLGRCDPRYLRIYVAHARQYPGAERDRRPQTGAVRLDRVHHQRDAARVRYDRRRPRIYVVHARRRSGAVHDLHCLQTGVARLDYVHHRLQIYAARVRRHPDAVHVRYDRRPSPHAAAADPIAPGAQHRHPARGKTILQPVAHARLPQRAFLRQPAACRRRTRLRLHPARH